MPRHSPYALFRLNSSSNLVLLDLLNCLSFANNCFLGCELHKKTILFLNSTIFHPLFRVFGKIVLDPFGSPLLLERPSNLIIKKSLNTTICFVSFFFIRFSMNVCAPRRLDHAMKKLITRFLSAGCFALHARSAGRPKWTRTTDLVLIRHAL